MGMKLVLGYDVASFFTSIYCQQISCVFFNGNFFKYHSFLRTNGNQEDDYMCSRAIVYYSIFGEFLPTYSFGHF